MPEIQVPETSAQKVPPKDARVVIIGGGVVGCSILFHLAKFGWKDVILLERDELTSGSSWHAAGQIHTLSSDPNISRLQGYTIALYKEIEELSGQDVGFHATGGFYLASTKSWYDYLKRERSKARYLGLHQEFISPEEVAHRHPLIDPKHYYAALWDEQDADLDPSGATYAFAKAARTFGAEYFTHCPVEATSQRADGSWDVRTSKGDVHAEIVVNCGGLWARELGAMAGLALPVQPMEHHYLITEAIPEIAAREARLPCGIDYEANIYFRQERQGMLLGTYEPSATPWQVGGTPMDFGHELLNPDLDRVADRLELAFERVPALAKAGIKDVINGPFTFGPDGNPMIGPVPGLRNYWVAVGVMAGFCQGGGVGLSIAEWMIDGEPSIDVRAMDVARFGEFATADWGMIKSSENYERRFVMTFPNETLPKGRMQKTTALYDRLVEKGALMDASFGLEHALWFANGEADAFEEPSFARNRSFDYVAREVRAVRENVGVIEIANFAKHEFAGKDVRKFLDYVLAGKLPKAGRLALSPMLTPKGKLYGDFTVANLVDEGFVLFGSGAMQEAHRRHFETEIERAGFEVRYRNASDDWHGLAVSGPSAKALVQAITRENLEEWRFRDIGRCAVGGVPVLMARISYSGEMGFEIYCAPPYVLRLAQAVEEAGADLGLQWYGARALMSLRLEKAWGAWGLDFTPDYTAHEAGLDGFVDQGKEFIGKAAMGAPVRRLVSMVIENTVIDVSGDEAIMRDGEAVGWVTSGGFAHHLGLSMAMGYVPVELAEEGAQVEVEILGEFYPAKVHLGALYDPLGERLRG